MRFFVWLLTLCFLLVQHSYASENVSSLYKNCLEKEHNILKLVCIDREGYIYIAYGELYKTESVGGPNLDSGWDYLRLQALSFDRSHNENKIQIMRQADFNKPEFIALFRKAIDWAEQEKHKNGDDLYAMSQVITQDINRESLKEQFEWHYLLLAMKKGHQGARGIIMKKSLE